MSVDIRDNLKQVIEDRCCVQAAIARRANISPDKLSLILSQNRKLEANELFDLCDALNMTPVELKNYKSKSIKPRISNVRKEDA